MTTTTPRDWRLPCRSESGEHYDVRESDGVWVCQICGDVRQKRKPAAKPIGRDGGNGGTP